MKDLLKLEDRVEAHLDKEEIRATYENGCQGCADQLDPFSTPVCRLAVILDSEGNAVTLHQVTKVW